MLVSILINNYNYGRFLGAAIDSALNQSYPHIEVIVVDDGSTDDSRAVMARYGDRIHAIHQTNSGQPVAIHTGFLASRGDIICLLDADDLFLPDKVASVVAAWRANPHACVVYHQMQNVDAQLQHMGRPWPHAVLRGNIRRRVERAGGWWPRPNTSALAFGRPLLERLMPVPSGPQRIWTDTYLTNAAPFFGEIVGIRAPLTLYRVHGANASMVGQTNPSTHTQLLRHRLEQYAFEFDLLNTTLRDKFAIAAPLALHDHPEYQRHRLALGSDVSLLNVVRATVACPTLPVAMKWRESLKVMLGRW
jgi:glycosyltransferase involved in cell wall biosynthesis